MIRPIPAVVLTLAVTVSLPAQTCDRGCLESFVDTYMEALIAHDPARLPTAPRVKNTEDGVPLELGDGFWRSARGKGSFRLFAADTETGQVAFIGTMREDPNNPVILAIRLKVANNRVAEIENLVVRDASQAMALENWGRPDQLFLNAVPVGERTSRDELIRVANAYYSGIEKNDGKGEYPVAADCDRHQNGYQTTNNPNFAAQQAAAQTAGRGGAAKGKGGAPKAAPAKPALPINITSMSCLEQFKSGYYNFIRRVRDRRFVAVDRERGLVAAIAAMDIPSGRFNAFKLADGREITVNRARPETIAFLEVFKIERGQIRRVEAVQLTVPYGMLSGWSSYEDGMSSRMRDTR